MNGLTIFTQIAESYIRGQLILLPLYLIFFIIAPKKIGLTHQLKLGHALLYGSLILTIIIYMLSVSGTRLNATYMFPTLYISSAVNTALDHPSVKPVYAVMSGIFFVGVLYFLFLVRRQFRQEQLLNRGQGKVRRFGRISLVYSDHVNTPFSTGLIKRIIYLPSRLAPDKRAVSAIVAHEAVHIREGHPLAGLADKAVRALGWYNPLSHLLVLKCHALREYVCDRAAADKYSDIYYSKVLVSEAEQFFYAGKWALSSAFINKSIFKRRLSMILKRQKLKTGKLGLMAAVLAGLMTIMIFGQIGCSSDKPAETERLPAAKSQEDALGDRNPQDIYKTVMANITDLREVYNGYKEETPGLEGKVVVEFSIDPSGTVIGGSIKKSTTGQAAFDKAVLSKVRQWKFDRVEKSGVAKITYPFAFSS